MRAFASLAALLLLGACSERELVTRSFGGPTMGTSYSVTCVASEDVDQAELERAVTAELAAVSTRASTWDAESELSRFNAHASTEPFAVSRELSALVGLAISLAHQTGGAFDPTVLPLVRALGFAAEGAGSDLDERALAAAREHAGFEKLRVEEFALVKLDPELELDLSGLVPGDAVDRVGAKLDELGASAWLIELGAEARARGTKLDGSPWVIGVEVPREGAAFGEKLLRRVALTDAALATSGRYRRARTAGSGRVHHVVDPRTGRNPTHDTVSVTVLAPTCARADGLATALLVLGADEGLRFLEATTNVEALFVQELGGELRVRTTPNFPREL